MKITVSRSLLADALRKVQGLASGRNSMPILSNVKIEAKDQKARFTTTDLDISVVLEIPCNVVNEGATTLPAKLLSDAITRATEGDVSLEVDDNTNKSTILAGSSVFRITGLSALDFPTLPAVETDKEFSIPQGVLKNLLRRTSYAMSQDETRRVLQGLHVQFEDGFLSCVATDGRRLAVAEYHPDEKYPFSLEFNLPGKAVNELVKHLGSTGNVVFNKCATQITASLDSGVVIYTRLVDDVYPNYRQVIPKDNTNEIKVDRQILISAIDRVGIFSEAHSMNFEFKDDELKLTSYTDTSKGEEGVPVKFDCEPIVATFNHSYILDVLKSIDDDEVTFLFSDGTRPVIIKDSLPGLALVMPLRVG